MTETVPETARLTADVVLLGNDGRTLHVLLIKRRWDPYEGHWALPGGHVDQGENDQAAAHRELAEETGLTVETLHFVGAYRDPGRDPRGRYATFAYIAIVQGLPTPEAGDDAAEAAWIPVRDVLAGTVPTAFDHQQIISDALDRRPR